jgi:Ala-tRNA(Pro) deacylase
MKIDQYLREQGVTFEHHTHGSAYTAQELAAIEHVSGYDVAKPVIVRADDDFVVCVVPASHKLDFGKVAAAMEAGECRLADEKEMSDLFPDTEIGAEPPFGNLYKLPTLVDRRLAQDEHITFAAGSHQDSISMRYADYARLSRPRVADLSVRL